MKHRLSLLAFVAAASLGFLGCGSRDDETTRLNQASQADATAADGEAILEGFLLAAGRDNRVFCPEGFSFDISVKMCTKGNQALGPFPEFMQQKCAQWGGGSACEKELWDKNFAAKLRGKDDCPAGATADKNGLCIEGNHAYGPFSVAHVNVCVQKGGGQGCYTMRWNKDFAIYTLPKEQPAEKYTFPFKGPATADYTVPPRSFGSSRSGGRLHAGVDLYGPVGRPIYSIGDGVIVDYYPFYDGTDAVVVKYDDFVIRYGEVRPGLAAGLSIGSRVKRGQVIAYVGHLQSLNMSMLHFEMYKGTLSGPLTVRENWPYQRRADLMDPTNYLLAWRYPQ